MESAYWHSNQQNAWNGSSDGPGESVLVIPAPRAAEWSSPLVSDDVPALPSVVFYHEVHASVAFNDVMKKFITSAVGLALFVAGYYHIHRQAEYVSAKSALSPATPGYETTPAPAAIRPIASYRLVKS